MKISKYCIWILLFGVFILSIVSASGDSKFCVQTGTCQKLSKEFSQPYCFSDTNECIWTSLTNNLSKFPDNIAGVIENYCTSLLWNIQDWRIYFAKPSVSDESTWDWQQTFDSHQSIFVYALCSSFKAGENKPFLKDDSLSWIFKDEDIVKVLKLKQRSGWKDNCSLADDKSLQNCDMSVYATEIFSAIMTDIFKIKYAQVLNVDSVENFDVEEKIQSFMHGYFNYNDKFDNLKKTFPKTMDVLKADQKYYKKVLDTVKLIDNSKVAECPEKWKTWLGFVACALHSSQGAGSGLTPSFITLVYNELLNYRVFEKYMQYRTNVKVNNLDGNVAMDYQSRLVDLQWYIEIQKLAVERSLRDFEDFNMTYPLHIGLLMYQEKIQNFRDKKLSPIITIFYSLSEKLQNVQLTS